MQANLAAVVAAVERIAAAVEAGTGISKDAKRLRKVSAFLKARGARKEWDGRLARLFPFNGDGQGAHPTLQSPAPATGGGQGGRAGASRPSKGRLLRC
jgi:hypothetical protein